MPPAPLRVLPCLLVLAAATACGGGSSSAGKSGASPTTTAASATASATPSAAAASSDCGGVLSQTKTALASYPGVTVGSADDCRSLEISSSLTKADIATSLKICDAASTIGYAGSILNVTVVGAGNVELAISVKGQQCIGEP